MAWIRSPVSMMRPNSSRWTCRQCPGGGWSDFVRAAFLLHDGRRQAAGESRAQRGDTFFEALIELPRVERREVFAQHIAVLAKALEEDSPVGPEDTAEAAKGGGLECGDRGDIEQVAGGERGGTVPQLLGQDLGGRFDEHGPSEYRFAAHWIRGEQAAGDEGDFAFGKNRS